MATIRYTLNGDYDPNDNGLAERFGGETDFSSPQYNTLLAGNPNFLVGDINSSSFLYRENSNGSNDAQLEVGNSSLFVDYSDKTTTVNLTGGDFGDILRSGTGDDNLNGGAGNDVLEGGAGGDAFDGGDGFDTVSYENATARVYINLRSPGDNSGDAVGDSFTSIEQYVGSSFNDDFQAAGDPVTVFGLGGNDTLKGGGGNDTLYGGIGNDTLKGGGGSNILVGGAGADELNGNEGIDTASYADSLEGVTVDLNIGTQTSAGDASGDRLMGIENLRGSAFVDTLTGDGNNNTLLGDAGDDILNGGAGDDVLEGGAGGDAFDGGDGFDTVSYENAGSGVTLDLVDPSNNFGDAAGDAFTSVEQYVGSSFDDNLSSADDPVTFFGLGGNDTLKGGGGNDILYGGVGDDTLKGGGGSDLLVGGTGADNINGGEGIDTVSYADSLEGVTVDLNIRIQISAGDANGDDLLLIENLIGSSFIDSLIGDVQNNTLNGGAGDDTLDGRGGNDRLVGGAGDDTFIVDNAGDLLYETADAGSGTDTVESSVTYKLRVNIENLTLTGTGDINGTGNDAANTLTGNGGNNTLDGRGGADTLIGGNGDDRYFVDNVSDRVTEATDGGNDTIISSVSYSLADAANVEKLVLVGAGAINATGTNGNDVLVGNDGDNVLSGGLGNDKLTGGAGEDTFIFDTTLSRTNADKITDFAHGVDQIGLSEAIFTALSGGTLSADAFKDVGASGATVDADDRILYDSGTGALSYDADGAGGTKAVAFALLSSKPAINHTDFFVFA